MIFLNKLILFSLIAVAIPIILHLLNLQKVKKMEFSSLMFLKDIQKSRFRRIRIKNLLLMLLRAAIFALLVFTFADPYLAGNAGSSNANKLGVIFIDSSYSMFDNRDSLNPYSKSLIAENKVRSLFSSSDLVYTFTTSVLSDTSGITIPVKPNLNSILNKLQQVKDLTKYKNTEVYIISDFQKVNFHDAKKNPSTDADFYFINTADYEKPNISVNSILIEPGIISSLFPVRYKVVMRNYSDNYIQNEFLKIYINGTLKETKDLNLKPDETKLLDFSFKPETTGINTLKVEITSSDERLDAFKNDNSYYAKINIPEKINIGIISTNPESSRFIKSVFDAGNNNSGSEGIYNYFEMSDLKEINNFDIIYLCGINKFSDDNINKINQFSKEDKGVIIFPSVKANVESYNKFRDLKIDGINNQFGVSGIAKINTESPLFSGIFKSEITGTPQNSSEIIILKSVYNIASSKEATSLLTLNITNKNESIPLLYSISSSPYIFASISPDTSMSSFPLHSLFSPIIIRSALLSVSAYPGNISLTQINHDTLESNPDIIDENLLKTTLAYTGIYSYNIIPFNEISTIEKTVHKNRAGKSFWYLPLIIAILLLPFEIYLSKNKSD